ncbi:MAG: hypothetical protein E7523_03545 [Ruminococcaceae bacterium]|nr:hypothetical protein [Oscillospiraceae bacterium]
MKKKLIAILLCVSMLFSFAAMTASASEVEDDDSARNEEGLITPANWTQFLMALFVRLFEIISSLFN